MSAASQSKHMNERWLCCLQSYEALLAATTAVEAPPRSCRVTSSFHESRRRLVGDRKAIKQWYERTELACD